MRFLEHNQIVAGVVPLDLQTARTGDAVSLKNYRHLTVVFFKAAGTDGDDPTLTFLQGTDVAFATNKALNVTEYHEKEGTLASIGTWTRVTQAAANTVAPGDPSAQSQGLYVFEFDADQLDADNGYDCVQVNIGDVGTNAQLGCILYFLSEPRYPSSAANMLSAIID